VVNLGKATFFGVISLCSETVILLLEGSSIVLLKFFYKFRETVVILVYPSLCTYLVDAR